LKKNATNIISGDGLTSVTAGEEAAVN